jgi:murein DD-endopeptidase MepM/ murein hydrolase activator NlpD
VKRTTRFCWACTLLAVVIAGGARAAVRAPDAGYTLQGRWEQGGLLVGRTDPQAIVVFDGRRLDVSPQGVFVFGLDRDAATRATLSVQWPGHAAQVKTFAVRKRPWKIQRIDGLPPAKVTPPADVEQRIEREVGEIRAALARDLHRDDFSAGLRWPVKGEVTGRFGNQRILNGTPKQPHFGVDVAVPVGTPVRAPAGGVVTLAEPDLYFTGGTLIIDHGQGLSSILVHLSKVQVKVGEQVQAGQVVAASGMTGRATGPHLHWGLYWFEAHLDPQVALQVLPAGRPMAVPGH